uniref:Neutral amino acid transporter 9 n=1 Tax=Phallusia mammillata TaxID=59560 RepID=A0A6F9DSV8_9ASCI|nr:putative sodium-coupled neutral amino acid transporter 9 [Phallusia mammillata]
MTSMDFNSEFGSGEYGPISFTPTDARLTKSVEAELKLENSPTTNKPRKPLMHPSWYSNNNPNSVGSIGSQVSATLEDDSEIHEDVNHSVLNGDLPRLSITFNRHKYYSRLVEPTDNRLQIPNHVLPSSLFHIIPTTSTDKQSSLVTIFAIWNTMMGTSLLSMPWGLGQAGFTFGVVIIVLTGCLTLYTAYRVLQSKDFIDGEVFEFSDVCKFYLGRCGEWIAVIFALITFLGGMMVYWVLMSNFMYVTGIFIHNKTMPTNVSVFNSSVPDLLCPSGQPLPDNGSSLMALEYSKESDLFERVWNSKWTVPVFLAILVFPLLNFKSPTFFTKFNCLGTLSVFFLLALVTTKAVTWGWNFEFHLTTNSTDQYLPQFRPTFPALTGMLSLAFFLHNAVITIVKNNRHPENNVRDLGLGYLLAALTYLSVGILFYGSFPLPKSCIASNLLENLSTVDPFAAGARVFLLFQMMTVFPLLAYMYRVNALYALFHTAWPGRLHVICVNLSILLICVLVAMFYPHIGDIIRYSGALCGLVYIFCLPSVVYMLSRKQSGNLTVLDIIFHSTIIVLGVLNFIAQFIIQPSK